MDSRNYSHLTTRSLSYLALLLSLAAVIASIVALQSSNNNQKKLNGQDTKLIQLNREVQLLNRPASTGAGVGPNDATQTVVPNGSGQ